MRVEAIVLRHQDWGEADRLLVLFTRQLGKVRGIAKGVRKPRSRKAGHLEPITQVNLLLARGRDMYIVTQAETIEAFLPLRENLLGVGLAIYAIELLDRFTYEEGENEALYRLLTSTLKRLVEEEDAQLVLRYYEMRLLDLLGFRPQMVNCVICEEEIVAQDQYFSAEHGGVLCPRCGKGVSGVQPVSVHALRYLRHFQRSSFTQARKAHPEPAIHREMEILINHYLTHLLERGLNTPAFLRYVRD